MSELEHFRQQVRAWLEQNCPQSMRRGDGEGLTDAETCWGGRKWVFSSEDQRLWLERHRLVESH